MLLLAFLNAISLLVAASAAAVDVERDSSHHDNASTQQERPRFQGYEPNHIVWRFNRSVDDSVSVRSSYRYYVTAPDFTYGSAPETSKEDGFFQKLWDNQYLFLSYTGEFDLFLTRDSSPVISREHNPAATLRIVEPSLGGKVWKGLKSLDVSVQHRSNGQTVEVDELHEGNTLEEIFENDPRHSVFDEISRGHNFVSLEISARVNDTRGKHDPLTGRCYKSPHCWDVWLRVNVFHWDDENRVTWGPSKGRKSITEYERLRAVVSKTVWFSEKTEDETWLSFSTLTLTGVVVVGDGGNPSFDIAAYLPIHIGLQPVFQDDIQIPLFFEFHKGPMAYLSDYTRSVTSMAIGLRIF